MDERLIRSLVTSMRCSVCGEHYGGENVRVLGCYTDIWFLTVYCPGCQSQGLVAAVLKEGEVPGLVTDLTKKEYTRFREIAAVDADDITDLHNFLKGFDGDFTRLFSGEAG